MRLLVVEDEKNLNKLITKKLTSEGYTVDSCFDGLEAMDYLSMASYDGVISDVMMPRLDGFQMLQKMRQQGNSTPVLFLTARDSIEDRVEGLDMGASDYLVKPFAFQELLARIRVLTRVKAQDTAGSTYSIADLTLNTATRQVTRGGRGISLSAKEFALLEYLLRNRDRVLSRDQIENNLWNFDYEGGTNAVDVYIRYLRKKIDEDFDRKLIHTVRGVGYVLRDSEEVKP
ncbi:MAG: response regulator transcription factor [Firmicutes bacterium]|nr:response regulator transcription factor [Bacillota bacterium]